jgi:hypothetical protein
VICRQPVETGDGKVSIEMAIQCEAADDACEELSRAFEGLNQKMIDEALRRSQ